MEFNYDNYKEAGISLLSKLISYASVLEEFDPNSTEPFGLENKEVLDFILEYAKKDGFDVFNDDNYAGHIEFGQGDELLGILCHLDVVPVADQDWVHDPFTLTIEDGKMYGRGTTDDKGPLAAAYLALKILKDSGFTPKKRIRLIMGCDEESGSRCLHHYFRTQELPSLGFSPDAEYPLIYGEKAHMNYNFIGELKKDEIIVEFNCGNRYNIVPAKATMKLNKDYKNEYLTFLKANNYQGEIIDDNYVAYGRASHAMCPDKGLNASFILFEFLNQVHPTTLSNFFVNSLTFDPFGKKLGYDLYDEEMLELTSNVGVVKINNGKILVGMDCRVPLESHKDKMVECISKASSEYGLSYEILSFGGYHYVNPNGTLVKTLMNAYQEVSGDFDSKPVVIGGGTYAKFIKNCVAFGPTFIGREDVCHIADEYLSVSDFMDNVKIYVKAIYELTK